MVDTFGEAFSKLPAAKIGHGSNFMRSWEEKKKAFSGDCLEETEQIPLPALGNALRKLDVSSSAYDFEDHCVIVSR